MNNAAQTFSTSIKSSSADASRKGAQFGRIAGGRELQTRILISASTAEVWKVLTDFTSYPEWSRFVQAISEVGEEGQQIKVRIKPEGGSAMDFTPQLLRFREARELRWLGKLFFKGLFDGEHYFRLEETSGGETLLIHGEIFRGLMVRPILATMPKLTESFEAFNQSLKARVEGTKK